MANHKPGTVWIRGVEVPVKRGQTARSELTLAKRWKWSRKKVRNFLKWLEKGQQIEQQKSNVTSLICIINYNSYQAEGITSGTSEGTTEEHQKNTKGYTNKNNKNNKNEKNITTYTSNSGSPKLDFSMLTNQIFEFWKKELNHPRAKLDQKRKQKIHARLKDGYSLDDIKTAISGCKASPYHQGENTTGAIYDDIELICRDGKHIDQFIKLAQTPNAKLISPKGRQAMQNGQAWLAMREKGRENGK
nr:hypothetical protein [uncultured Desulfobacter sp.]